MSDVKFKFTADTNAAQAAVRQFTQGVTAGFQSMLAPIAAAFSVAVIKQWVSAQIDAADAASKTAQKVGMSTEALTANQYAARLADVSNEEFTIGMKTLAQVVVDAARGQEVAVAALQRLQLNVRNSAGELRTLEELLPEIADAFQAMPDGITKSDTAVQLFGRSGLNLIPMLNGGAAGLKQLREEAQRLGVTIDGETGRTAEEFNDNLTRLRLTVQGVALSLAKELLPYLQAFSDYLVQGHTSVMEFKGAIDLVVTGLKYFAVTALSVANAVQLVGTVIYESVTTTWTLYSKALEAGVKIGSAWLDNLGAIRLAVVNLAGELGKLAAVAVKFLAGDLQGAAADAQKILDRTGLRLELLATQLQGSSQKALEAFLGFVQGVGEKGLNSWDSIVEEYKRGGEQLTALFTTLFNPKAAGAATKATSPARPVVVDEKAATATREALEKITAEYEQAFYEQERLINLATAEQLAAFGDQVRQTKNLRAEDLANDSDYQAAKLMLEQTAARKQEQIAREKAQALFNLNLQSNDLELQRVRGNGALTEDQKLQALNPLLAERNRLLEESIQKERALVESAGVSDAVQLAAKERINQLLGQQLSVQQEIADRERLVNEQRLRGTQTMFSNMAQAAKAFGKEGFAAYKAFAIAAAVIDTASGAIAAYKSVAGIPLVGPVLAPIAAAAAVAAGAAQIATINAQGFARGGEIAGGERLIRVNEEGTETVMNARATARYRGLLAAMNSGVDAIGLMRQRSLASPVSALEGMGAASPEVNVAAAPVSVVVLKDAGELKQFLESNAGRRIVVQHVRNSRTDLGLET